MFVVVSVVSGQLATWSFPKIPVFSIVILLRGLSAGFVDFCHLLQRGFPQEGSLRLLGNSGFPKNFWLCGPKHVVVRLLGAGRARGGKNLHVSGQNLQDWGNSRCFVVFDEISEFPKT